MKNKPKIHFWMEAIGGLEGKDASGHYMGTTVYAVHACRAWDVPANGVFMLFMHQECRGVHGPKGWIGPTVDYRDLLTRKLEARERALINWYGRQAKHHLDQFELTPAERKQAALARAAQHERGNASPDF